VLAHAGCFESIATGADLEALRDGGEAEFRRNGVTIPRHEGGADLENFIAINADDLGDLGGAVGVGQVVFEIFADIDLAEDAAAGEVG